MRSLDVSVIIPVFNEAHTIESVINSVHRDMPSGISYEIIIVDDGSTDKTPAILRSISRCRLLRHSHNQGKGSAIHSGLNAARGQIILLQDADGEYSTSDIPAILREFSQNAATVVYGRRQQISRTPTRVFSLFFWGGWLVDLTTFLLFGNYVRDISSGYKAFRREVLERAKLIERRFAFCAEVTIHCIRAGQRINSVPVSYRARKRSQGKKLGILDGLRIIWFVIKKRFTLWFLA